MSKCEKVDTQIFQIFSDKRRYSQTIFSYFSMKHNYVVGTH